MSGRRFVSCYLLLGCVFVHTSSADDAENLFRARLLATPLETELRVTLDDGQLFKGALLDVDEAGFLVLSEPDKETRKRLGLRSGLKLKKTLRYADVASIEGAIDAELVESYLVLQEFEPARMQALLTAAAAASYRVIASAGRRTVVLERADGAERFDYVVPEDARSKSEAELDGWGAQGFRVVPRTIGAWLGEPSVILERSPSDASSRDYRVLQSSPDEPLEPELSEAVQEGYRLVGLTTPGPRIVILEADDPSEAANGLSPDYLSVGGSSSSTLAAVLRDGHRLVACSDGEPLCVFEKRTEGAQEASYEFLSAARISTMEKELNEAGLRGYRFHPLSLGVLDAVISESFALMEKTSLPGFEYRVVAARRAGDLQERVGGAAREGFRVVAMTAERKKRNLGIELGLYAVDWRLSGAGGGLTGSNLLVNGLPDVYVVMERPLR